MTMKTTSSFSDCSYQMLCEMNDKAKKLCDLMKQGIVEFIFKKKSTGKMRHAKGTLKRSLIPPEFQRKRGRPKKHPEDLVIYYDVDKQDIRSFKDYLLQKVVKKPSSSSKQKQDSTSNTKQTTNDEQDK